MALLFGAYVELDFPALAVAGDRQQFQRARFGGARMQAYLHHVAGLAVGLQLGGLAGAGWGVSAAMLLYFGYFFWALWTWE